ncbi:MAG: SDR family NAD(P)-dependent oxidoreductase [Methyloceanibacter sp.]|nr:SDR family NAD(P)-dependent oxidoreductase [Methyloceanibacter sp.]
MTEEKSNSEAQETPQNPSRRSALLGGAAGALVAAAAVVGGTQPTKAQSAGDMQGKTAFITGGARGIGLASADELARAGANIVIYDIAQDLPSVNYALSTDQDLAKAKAQIEGHGVMCMSIKGDVRDRAALAKAVAQTVSQFGSLDHMCVNAGVTQVGSVDELADDAVQTVIDINLTGAVRTVQAAVPVMRDQKSGSIVVISSILGRRANEWYSVYSATKWAVIGLAKATSLAVAPHGVTCNVICPTLVRTPLAESLIPAFSPENPTWEAVEDIMRELNPLPVAAYKPEDVARLVRFFASDDARLISGEVFNLDGGALSNAVV